MSWKSDLSVLNNKAYEALVAESFALSSDDLKRLCQVYAHKRPSVAVLVIAPKIPGRCQGFINDQSHNCHHMAQLPQLGALPGADGLWW